MGLTETVYGHYRHMFHIDSDIEPDGYWVVLHPCGTGAYGVAVCDADDKRILVSGSIMAESPRRAAEKAVSMFEEKV